LVLATYKAESPDALSALQEAKKLLAPLNPEESNDPETVGLAGAIEKRLFDRAQGDEHINLAIRYYARGYFLRNDRYNGINLSYLLNVRTDTALDSSPADKIADLVWANRLRTEVLLLCDEELKAIANREQRTAAAPAVVQQEQFGRDEEQKFWCLATKAEAHFGLGQMKEYDSTLAQAKAVKHAAWMWTTFSNQIERLRQLLLKHGGLLSPPWREGGA
jgi:hypothetical protein